MRPLSEFVNKILQDLAKNQLAEKQMVIPDHEGPLSPRRAALADLCKAGFAQSARHSDTGMTYYSITRDGLDHLAAQKPK